VFLLSEPGKSLCVVALVRSRDFGGTTCGPEDLGSTRPGALVLEGGGSLPAWLLFGAAPDNVASATARTADGTIVKGDVVDNSYELELVSPPTALTLNWVDGTHTSVTAG
jgi:hypothetical protein